MRDRDAGDGGPPDVIIRDQEGAGYRGQHADLVTGVREVRPDGRLDLADDLERARAHDGNARTRTGLQVPAPRYRSHGAIYLCVPRISSAALASRVALPASPA